jgi:hypothetical protein
MGTILEIVDAVKGLTLTERAELFAKLREFGIGPSQEEQSSDYSRRCPENNALFPRFVES